MTKKVTLLVDWCSYEAARFATKHWHYSKSMPAGKTSKVGVWEDGVFCGVVIFSRGANNNIGKPFGLTQFQVCELTRVALNNHECFVSQILSLAIKKLRSKSPGVRLLVSYADPNHGHLGSIYQANNWIYIGPTTTTEVGYLLNGVIYHAKSVFNKYGTKRLDWLRSHVASDAQIVHGAKKYKYLYPLDRAMRRQIEKLSKPYPKHADD